MRIAISCGPIPARLDSVKFITNRFKGGLAFKTAAFLIEKGYDVTIIKWEHTNPPVMDGNIEFWNMGNVHFVDVSDVFSYYAWFESHATEYNAFIMAAAVANLAPSTPFSGKFPSHNYKVGDEFPITFQIAPRAIDVIKEKNPRCCLIGYKLFDAQPEELINIGKHTLHDSKANIIFANTPTGASVEKYAIMQDNTVLQVTFDEHLKMIDDAIQAKYFKTIVEPLLPSEESDQDIKKALSLVAMFEKTFPGHGSVAVGIDNWDFVVTTSRGHKEAPVMIRKIDWDNRLVYATGKATLNAPMMYSMLESHPNEVLFSRPILIHRHLDDTRNLNEINIKTIPYVFPGTIQEIAAVTKAMGPTFEPVRIAGHGDVYFREISPVNWSHYYENFPAKYFSTPKQIQELIEEYRGKETLEIGGNKHVDAKYAFDRFVKADNAINFTDINEVEKHHYDLVIMRNSVNYLWKPILSTILSCTDRFIANTFLVPPESKITDNEAAVYNNDSGQVDHFLLLKNDNVEAHSFWAYTKVDYEGMGLTVEPYGKNSAILTYTKECTRD